MVWIDPQHPLLDRHLLHVTLIEDATQNPHYISIPYVIEQNQTTNLSIYAQAGSNSQTLLGGGTASFAAVTTAGYTQYIMTLQTVPTVGMVTPTCVVNAAGLSTPQMLSQTLTGTVGAAGSTYLCYPGWTKANIGTEAFTGVANTNRYLTLLLGLGNHLPFQVDRMR